MTTTFARPNTRTTNARRIAMALDGTGKPKRPAKRADRGASIEAWRAKNPLKKWMDTQGKGLQEIATQLGVTRQQLYNYLIGYSLPDLKGGVQIAKTTGIDLEDWVRWFGHKPQAAVAAHQAIRKGTRAEGKP